MPAIMKENVKYAYTDKGVKAHTLSYAEYQALSTEEKMNGDLYFIPDKQPEGNPSLIWDKLGTATLDTDADNISDAVNELNSRLTNLIIPYTVTLSNIAAGGAGYQGLDIDVPTGYKMQSFTVTQPTLLNLFIVWGGSINNTTNRIAIMYNNQRTSAATATVEGVVICVPN